MDMMDTLEVHINGVPADLWAAAKATAAMERLTLREYVILVLSIATGAREYGLRDMEAMYRIWRLKHPGP
jgi:hypothetical protein